jgi:hypothetical protein
VARRVASRAQRTSRGAGSGDDRKSKARSLKALKARPAAPREALDVVARRPCGIAQLAAQKRAPERGERAQQVGLAAARFAPNVEDTLGRSAARGRLDGVGGLALAPGTKFAKVGAGPG